MQPYLLLIRHGQAQDLQVAASDASRHLTAAGARALSATIEVPLGLLSSYCKIGKEGKPGKACNSGRVVLWTSGYNRAYETAVLVSAGRKELTPEVKRHLESCDIQLFDFELDAQVKEWIREGAGDCVVIVVGHEPMMSELIDYYSGNAGMPVSKGSATLMKLECDAGGIASREGRRAGRLLWSVQGPEAKRWQTLIDIETILRKQYGLVRSRMDVFLRTPSDVDAVHQLRVSIRTMRSLLAFVAGFMRRSQNRRMQRDLRDIVRRLSRLRELDVLVGVASSNESLSPLLSVLAQARIEECLGVLKAFGGRETTRAISRLDKAFAHIEWRACVEKKGLAKQDVVACFAGMLAAYDERFSALDYSDVQETHSVRKDAKRVRYSAAAFKQFLGDDAANAVAKMRAVQEELGELCDARVNVDLLQSLMRLELDEQTCEAAKLLAGAERDREKELLCDLRAQAADGSQTRDALQEGAAPQAGAAE